MRRAVLEGRTKLTLDPAIHAACIHGLKIFAVVVGAFFALILFEVVVAGLAFTLFDYIWRRK
jgi:type III secretory pathway component EscU